jgi:FAD/FMN-containing dehydrogenase
MAPTRRRFFGQAALVAGGVAGATGVGGRIAAAQGGIDPAALDALRGRLQGRLVVPGDETFDRDRRVFYTNPRTETKPAVIVQCGHADDVPRAVEFARRYGLELAVRSGGHSHLAWGSSGGLVIDLAPLRRIAVDPARRIVTVDGGVLGGDVAVAAGKHGLAPVLGQCPGVGAAGVTLGGGLGWLSGLFGACCDSLLSASIVTADGSSVEADAARDPDLLWGLQGAGANFGVATSLTARLHPLGPVIGGDIHYAPRDARDVLRGFRDVMHAAADALQATLNLTRGDRGLFISFCHAGSEADAERLLETLRTIARPTKEAVTRQDYAALATKAAATASPASAAAAFRSIEAVYRDRVSDEVIDIFVDRLASAPVDAIFGLSHYMHGAVCRVAPDATAFPHRRAHSIHLRVACQWADPTETERRFAWTDEWRRLCRPTSDETIYANYQTYSTERGGAAIFATNHDRLARLKARLDPDNVFHRNANVSPARG